MMKNTIKSAGFFMIVVSMFLAVSCAASIKGRGQSWGGPGQNVYSFSAPGETARLERAGLLAPPFVPHSIEGFKTARDGNDCLDCHLSGVEVNATHTAPKVPGSHYVNLHTGEKKSDMVVGIRYNCLQCHVPQAQ